MKSAIALITFAALSTVSANAADLASRPYTKAPMLVDTAYNWTGFYLGGNVGGEWGRLRNDVSVPALTAFGLTAPAGTIPLRSSNDSFTGGGQIGYRWQSASPWVWGLEGDFNYVNLRSSQTLTPAFIPPGNVTFVANDSLAAKTDWQASIRGNIGYAWDRWLGYVTGGVSFADVRSAGSFIPVTVGVITFPGSAGAQTKTLVGGTVGAGVAYAFGNNWDIGAEYRHTWYDGADFALGSIATIAAPGGATFASVAASSHVSLSTDEVRLRLNYRFGGPVMAKF